MARLITASIILLMADTITGEHLSENYLNAL